MVQTKLESYKGIGETSKKSKQDIIFDALYFPMSRHDLECATGLTMGCICARVSELMDVGLIEVVSFEPGPYNKLNEVLGRSG